MNVVTQGLGSAKLVTQGYAGSTRHKSGTVGIAPPVVEVVVPPPYRQFPDEPA